MKRLGIAFLMVLFLSSCDFIWEQEGVTEPVDVDTDILVCEEDEYLQDGSCIKMEENTMSDALLKLEEYITWANEIVGYEGGEGEFYNPNIRPLSNTNLLLEPDALEDIPNREESQADMYFFEAGSYVLMEFKAVMEQASSCQEAEGDFCDVSLNETDYSIRFELNGDKLFMEQYSVWHDNSGSVTVISIQSLILDTVDDHMEFGFLRDNTTIHNDDVMRQTYYDMYIQGQYAASFSANENEYYMQKIYDQQNRIELVSETGEGLGINYYNPDTSLFSSLNYDPDGSLSGAHMIQYDGNNNVLHFYKGASYISLNYNLKYVDGWDYVDFDDYGNQSLMLLNGENISNFDIYIDDYPYVTANIEHRIEGQVAEDMFDLSIYGMSFTEVGYEDIIGLYESYESNLGALLEQMGLTNDFSENVLLVQAMYGHTTDETIYNEIFAKVILN
jgi:hypothetical protein